MTSRHKALQIAAAALDSKADALTVLDLRKISATFEYFVIGSATSPRRAQAIADAIEAQLKPLGARLWHQEGYGDGDWILLDYGSVVAHIFTPELRTFYQLERLWGDAPRLSWPRPRPRRALHPSR